MSNPYSTGDIDVQKIKVKNTIFEFSAWSHVYLCMYFYNIYINVWGSLLGIQIHIMYIDTTNI